MTYKQLTSSDRYTLSALKRQGVSVPIIVAEIGCHRSTIYRELERNSCYRTDGSYRPGKASERTNGRRPRSGRNSQYKAKDFRLIRKLLRKKYSLKQIVGYLQIHNLMERIPCHKTIYKYIWKNKSNGSNLWKHLRQSSKQRRKRYKAYDSRGRLANKWHISERPPSVEARRYFAHREIDTVKGKGSKDCIVTLVERKTGLVQIGKLLNSTTAQLNKRTVRLIDRFSNCFKTITADNKTITADNGTEFHQYAHIEQQSDVKFYFANTYHSWERGSNENMNGLIRQYLPKGTSMEKLTQQQCGHIAHQLNTRPRERFNFKTPWELFNTQL